jgi:hypothetical protein
MRYRGLRQAKVATATGEEPLWHQSKTERDNAVLDCQGRIAEGARCISAVSRGRGKWPTPSSKRPDTLSTTTHPSHGYREDRDAPD